MTTSSTSADADTAVKAAPHVHPSRRTVLTSAAWAIPAVSLAVATPAFATSGPGVTLSSPSNRVLASGQTTITASVNGPSGSPSTGAAVSFIGPSGSTFNPPSTTTDAAGSASTTFDLKNTWATPGSSVTVTAVSGASSTSQSFTVVGSNAVKFGSSFTASPTQTDLVFPSPVVSITVGGAANTGISPAPAFSVALLQDGTVWTTGTNSYGELGDGTTTARSTWALVPGLTQVKQIAVGLARVMALRTDGSILAWGFNSRGGVGDGTTINRSSPTPVLGLPSNIQSIASSGNSGFALTTGGALYGWGRNLQGEIGQGNFTNPQLSPVQVAGLPASVVTVVAGYQTVFAILSDGSLWSWGWNVYGQVGDGTTTDRNSPTKVTGLSTGVAQVTCGSTNTAVLMKDGSVKAWGWNGHNGVGDGSNTATNALTPVGVTNLTSGVRSIFASNDATYAVRDDGSVVGWGGNGEGQLGNGAVNAYGEPAPVKTNLPAGQVAVLAQLGSTTAAATYLVTAMAAPLSLTSPTNEVAAAGGTTITATLVDAFGTPVSNGLVSFSGGSGATFSPASATTNSAGVATTTFNPHTPWAKPGSTVTVSATSGSSSVSQDFTVLGSNLLAFGMGATSTPAQTELVFPSPVIRVVGAGSGSYAYTAPLFSVALLENGTVWTKGTNGYGQLGDGTTTDRNTWAQVGDVWNVTQIVVGWEQVLTLHSDGTVKRWGRTTDPNPVTRPQTVGGVTGVLQLAQSAGTTFALLSNGSVTAWGPNDNGNAGTGSTTPGTTPTQVVGLTSGVTRIGSGFNFAGAVLSDGTARTWGLNGAGQLGDGSTTNRDTPTTPAGWTGSASEIVGNMGNTFILRADGSVVGCGQNDAQGELGNGQTSPSTNPTFSALPGLTSGVKQLTLTASSGYVLMNDGSVRAWGANSFGQLGDGSTSSKLSPTALTTLPADRSILRLADNSPTSNTMYLITG